MRVIGAGLIVAAGVFAGITHEHTVLHLIDVAMAVIGTGLIFVDSDQKDTAERVAENAQKRTYIDTVNQASGVEQIKRKAELKEYLASRAREQSTKDNPSNL